MQGLPNPLSAFYSRIVAFPKSMKSRYIQARRIPRWKKALIISSISLLIIFGALIALISPVTKYLVEKYDLKYTGRQITMDWAYVNPFTGYFHFENLKIYELNSDSVFISSKGISVNLSMRKLLNKTYEISEHSVTRAAFLFKIIRF
jgi:heme/copper-type cytochrome/quinol oxidase subunit 1